MLAASDLTYAQLYDLLGGSSGNSNRVGRQIAHAMAHGSYACRTHAIVYNEETGKFAYVRAN